MPQLRSLYTKHSQKMVILGVDAGERADTPAAQARLGIAGAKRNQLNYPVLLNGDNLLQEYGASGFPATFLVDPAGRIQLAQVGASPDLWPKVEAIIASYNPPGDDRDGIGGPKKASQIGHELTFPMPPGPREIVVGQQVMIHFQRPEDVPADLVSLSVDGKQVAVFGAGSSYPWDATTVSNGVHTLRIAAQTASGRETWAVQQAVIVDNRPPVAPAPAASPKARKTTRARRA